MRTRKDTEPTSEPSSPKVIMVILIVVRWSHFVGRQWGACFVMLDWTQMRTRKDTELASEPSSPQVILCMLYWIGMGMKNLRGYQLATLQLPAICETNEGRAFYFVSMGTCADKEGYGAGVWAIFADRWLSKAKYVIVSEKIMQILDFSRCCRLSVCDVVSPYMELLIWCQVLIRLPIRITTTRSYNRAVIKLLKQKTQDMMKGPNKHRKLIQI